MNKVINNSSIFKIFICFLTIILLLQFSNQSKAQESAYFTQTNLKGQVILKLHKDNDNEQKSEDSKPEVPSVPIPSPSPTSTPDPTPVSTPSQTEPTPTPVPKTNGPKTDPPKSESPKLENAKKEDANNNELPKTEKPNNHSPEPINRPPIELPPPQPYQLPQIIKPQGNNINSNNVQIIKSGEHENNNDKKSDASNNDPKSELKDNPDKQKPNVTNNVLPTEDTETNNNKNTTPAVNVAPTPNHNTPAITSTTPAPESCSCTNTEQIISTGSQTGTSEGSKSCQEICAEQTAAYSNTNNPLIEIPKGSTFATSVFIHNDKSRLADINEGITKDTSSAVLTDSNGETFNVGFAFFQPFSNQIKKELKLKTLQENFLELITIINVPANASEGDATISIFSENQRLTTIPLKIISPKEVRIGKKKISNPSIRDPIFAELKKSYNDKLELNLKIKGRNFIGSIAIIDGQLQKLIDKAKFFTNIVFAPEKGIKIKNLQVLSSEEINLTAEISNDISGGIKFVNIITPRGIDVAAINFPEELVEGRLEATSKLESLILYNQSNLISKYSSDGK